MSKKLALMGATGAVVVAMALGAGAPAALACTGADGQTNGGQPQLGPTLPDGGHIYGAGDAGALSGYLGAAGPLGYVEGNGNASNQTAQIDGSTTDGTTLNGRLTVNGTSSGACINGMGI